MSVVSANWEDYYQANSGPAAYAHFKARQSFSTPVLAYKRLVNIAGPRCFHRPMHSSNAPDGESSEVRQYAPAVCMVNIAGFAKLIQIVNSKFKQKTLDERFEKK